MADQFPIISGTRAINASATASTSLIGRGLSAIQRKETGLVRSELDARYRQARDIYNRITDYSCERRFNADLLPIQGEQLDLFEANPLQPFYDMFRQLADVFIVFQQLADQGYGKAYYPLANMYRGGQGISQNIDKADYYSFLVFNWCFSNQALHDPEILCDLGCLYRNGFNVSQGKFEQDDEEAFICYGKAAEQSYARGQYYLGKMYADGCYVAQNAREAVYWYRKAAEQGDTDAQNGLGWIYNNGHGVEKDYEQAVFWYRKAAEQGHADAQCNLGGMYDNGSDVAKDYTQGTVWTHGEWHGKGVNGSCVVKDDKQAVSWYRKAAEQGNASAQCNLGLMYQYGRGIEQDDEQAVFWYRRAADQDHASAQRNLSWMYEYGCGVEQDDE